VFASPPAGAVAARLLVINGGVWTAAETKAVFGVRPFFGEIAPGVEAYPAWDPGGSNVVGTVSLAPGSAGELIESVLTQVTGNYGNTAYVSVSSAPGVDWGGFDAVVTAVMDCAAQADGNGSPVALYATMERVGGNLVDNPPQGSPARTVLFQPVTVGTNTYRGALEFSHRFPLQTLRQNFGESPHRYTFRVGIVGTQNVPAWAASNVYLRVKIEKR
jgi:hypothetical protein